MTGISKSPESKYWRQLYRAALFEIDDSKLPGRIEEAEKAFVLRARELFQAAGENGEETEALDHVMYALRALQLSKSAPNFSPVVFTCALPPIETIVELAGG